MSIFSFSVALEKKRKEKKKKTNYQMKMYWNKNIFGLKYPIWVWDQSVRLSNISIYTNTPKKIPSTSYIYSFCVCNIKLDILRASATYNTILMWKLHYFSLILAPKFFSSPTIAPKFILKLYFCFILLNLKFIIT